MSTTLPLTIGVPVYNGENYLSEALEALLAQTFTDFELVISDNASTDATAEICADFAARDSRIRYVRQRVNIGAAPNHNFVVTEARGAYFKWAAHDDLFGPKLVESCIGLLEDDEEAVLAHSFMGIAGPDGSVLEEYDYQMETDSPSAATRFRSLMFTEGGDDFYGVVRTSVMRRVTPHGSYYNAGRKFVAELALYGRFRQVPEVMFLRREHPGRGDNLGTIQRISTNMDPRRAGQSTGRLVAELVAAFPAAINRAPLCAQERRRCYSVYASWIARRTVLKPFEHAA